MTVASRHFSKKIIASLAILGLLFSSVLQPVFVYAQSGATEIYTGSQETPSLEPLPDTPIVAEILESVGTLS